MRFVFRKLTALAAVFTLLLSGCAAHSNVRANAASGSWGVQVEGIRLTAGGYYLDFRYRILDPELAVKLMDRSIKPYLVNEATGEKCYVPSSPKIGSLRSTPHTGKPIKGRTYFVIFSNLGHAVKSGCTVTVVIGDFRSTLTVS